MPSIKSTSYNIQIEQGSFNALNKFLSKKEYSKYIIICDENTSENCLSNLLFACETLTAAEIIELTNSKSQIIYLPLPEDDPLERKPDISRAIQHLTWEPKIERLEGLSKTIEYFKQIV